MAMQSADALEEKRRKWRERQKNVRDRRLLACRGDPVRVDMRHDRAKVRQQSRAAQKEARRADMHNAGSAVCAARASATRVAGSAR